MTCFIPEIHKLNITESDGFAMTILIGMSFHRRDVYFELHKTSERYKLYWCYETFMQDFAKFYLSKGLQGTPLEEALKIPEVRKYCDDNTVQDSAFVNKKDASVFEWIIQEGLPEVDNKPRGFDGHSYTVTVIGNPDRVYRLWCALPDEWGELRELIGILRRYAGLGKDYAPID